MIPQRDEVWRECRPPNIDPDWLRERRRVVQVATADEHGFVEGVGWWQKRAGDGWVDETWPGVRRKTRVRTAAFLRRYEPINTEVRAQGTPTPEGER